MVSNYFRLRRSNLKSLIDEKGAFMWLSINYAIGKLGITDNQHAVTIDLGGGST